MALIASACLNGRFASHSLLWCKIFPSFEQVLSVNPSHCCLLFQLREWLPAEVLDDSLCSGACLFRAMESVSFNVICVSTTVM